MGVWGHNENKKQTTICVSEGQERKRTAQKKLLKKRASTIFQIGQRQTNLANFKLSKFEQDKHKIMTKYIIVKK